MGEERRKRVVFVKEEKERVAWANIATLALNVGVMTSMEERRVEQAKKAIVIIKDKYKEQLRMNKYLKARLESMLEDLKQEVDVIEEEKRDVQWYKEWKVEN